MKFELEGQEFITLCDLLKRVGACESGGFAKSEIAAGVVLVDGEVELRKRFKVRVNQTVEYNGHNIKILD